MQRVRVCVFVCVRVCAWAFVRSFVRGSQTRILENQQPNVRLLIYLLGWLEGLKSQIPNPNQSKHQINPNQEARMDMGHGA